MTGPLNAPLDPPRHLKPAELASRYGITPRLAGEWIRRMIAAGVVAKIGNLPVGRLSVCDDWVASGGKQLKRSRGGRP